MPRYDYISRVLHSLSVRRSGRGRAGPPRGYEYECECVPRASLASLALGARAREYAGRAAWRIACPLSRPGKVHDAAMSHGSPQGDARHSQAQRCRDRDGEGCTRRDATHCAPEPVAVCGWPRTPPRPATPRSSRGRTASFSTWASGVSKCVARKTSGRTRATALAVGGPDWKGPLPLWRHAAVRPTPKPCDHSSAPTRPAQPDDHDGQRAAPVRDSNSELSRFRQSRTPGQPSVSALVQRLVGSSGPLGPWLGQCPVREKFSQGRLDPGSCSQHRR